MLMYSWGSVTKIDTGSKEDVSNVSKTNKSYLIFWIMSDNWWAIYNLHRTYLKKKIDVIEKKITHVSPG